MAEKSTLADAFAYFKVKGKNPRWSWSARSEDGKTVVLTLWKDEFGRGDGKQVSYHARVREDAADWTKNPGNRERLENLKWAKEHCDGLFRVVIGIAEDVNARPRTIKECFPQKNLVMRIVDLNEETGEFHAVSAS